MHLKCINMTRIAAKLMPSKRLGTLSSWAVSYVNAVRFYAESFTGQGFATSPNYGSTGLIQ